MILKIIGISCILILLFMDIKPLITKIKYFFMK